MERVLVVAFCFAFAFLVGCATNAVLADLEDDKAIVQVNSFAKDKEVIRETAEKGCAIHGKEAVPVSWQCVDANCVRARYLFACK